ncbi:MAG TPA: hypothetical protein VLD19_18835 [Chitinophagaceae bacterium]|nr:hypothetical protein [Chitinophagaceae bacterium]
MQQKGNEFKALQILHMAMLTGMALFAVVAVFLVTKGLIPANKALEKPLQVVALLVSVGSTAAGFALFNKRIKSIQPTDTVASRITIYRAAAILRWALIEFPVLLSIISFILTGNYAFLALAIALILVFVVVRPAKPVIIFLLQLNEKEVSELEGLSE